MEGGGLDPILGELTFIGLGLFDELGISLRGLEEAKKPTTCTLNSTQV